MLRLSRRAFPFVETVFADGGYAGRLGECAQSKTHVALEIVKRPRRGAGFAIRRRVVERTVAWIMKRRRLVRDHERLASVAEALSPCRHPRQPAGVVLLGRALIRIQKNSCG